MSQWYHAHKGKTVGPYSLDQIEQMITQGQMGTMDLVFRVGSNEWKPVCEWPELNDSPVVQRHHQRVDMWVVFIDRENDKKQIGPFSTEKIKAMLARKEILFEDYVWKEGMSEWYPIKTLQDFKIETKANVKFDDPDVKEDLSVYQQSAADLLQSIQVKDDKQIKEITQTISFVKKKEKTKTKASIKTDTQSQVIIEGESDQGLKKYFNDKKSELINDKEERERQKAELKSLRAQLEEKMQALFGENNESQDETKIHHKKNPMAGRVDEITENLPLTKKLKEDGVLNDDVEKTNISKVTSILKEEDESDNDNDINESKEPTKPFYVKLASELSNLFPKGSLLRLFALFFLFFSFSVIIFLSSMRDKEHFLEEKKEVKAAMTQAQKEQIEKQKAEEQARWLKQQEIERIKRENTPRPPTFVKMKLLESDSQQQLIVSTDASKHFTLKVEMYGQVGDVLNVGAYYNSFELPVREELKFSLSRYNIPPGYIRFRAEIGKLKKSRKAFLYKGGKKEFLDKMVNHKKNIAVWHQKEKRALYKSVSLHKDYAPQLSSLLPLNKDSKNRFSKAYSEWKKKLVANRSDYLKKINTKVEGAFVYPLLWLKLKEQENMLLSLDLKNPNFNVDTFVTDVQNLEKEIQDLSLW
ncbi:MAG: DUF4339 domain-containing protein [Bdellovibrionales bacterium]|nr:DUF4339 domain-containing protein [Bdellovibrionales bacterium]